MLFVAIAAHPPAGVLVLPLYPFGALGSLLWLAMAFVSGGLLALLGTLVVSVSAAEMLKLVTSC